MKAKSEDPSPSRPARVLGVLGLATGLIVAAACSRSPAKPGSSPPSDRGDAGGSSSKSDASSGRVGTEDAGASVVTLDVAGGSLRIELCTDVIVRVAFAKDSSFFTRSSAATAPKRCTSPLGSVATGAEETIFRTAKL